MLLCHQIHKIIPPVTKARIVIRRQVGDENLISDLPRLLDQTAQLTAVDVIRHRMDDCTQLSPVAIWDVFEYLFLVPLLESGVCCFEYYS